MLKLRLYCPVDVPTVSGVISVLTYCVSERGACIQSYRIFYVFCAKYFRKDIIKCK